MYKKIIFGCVAILFAAASAFNIGLIQTQNAGDISLDAITIMAQASWSEYYTLPWDFYDDIFKTTYDTYTGLTNAPGNPCYEYLTSHTVGGSYTVSHSSSSSTTVTVSFTNFGVTSGVTDEYGVSHSSNYSTTISQHLLGYEIICKTTLASNDCRPRSCDEVRMNY